jgi:hypothetical protein
LLPVRPPLGERSTDHKSCPNRRLRPAERSRCNNRNCRTRKCEKAKGAQIARRTSGTSLPSVCGTIRRRSSCAPPDLWPAAGIFRILFFKLKEKRTEQSIICNVRALRRFPNGLQKRPRAKSAKV